MRDVKIMIECFSFFINVWGKMFIFCVVSCVLEWLDDKGRLKVKDKKVEEKTSNTRASNKKYDPKYKGMLTNWSFGCETPESLKQP